MTISISGVILGSEVDSLRYREDIEAGMITPSSKACREIAAVKTGLNIRINSPGGSAIDANSIANAVVDWIRSHKEQPTVTIDSLAASAAANLVAALRPSCRILAYSNTLLMFHSCYVEAFGASPDEMRDVAIRGDKINDTVIENLLQYTELKAATVLEWFKAGREGWLDSSEALKAGLIDDILDGNPAALPDVTSTIASADVAARRLDVAIIAAEYHQRMEKTPMSTIVNEPSTVEEPLEPIAEEATAEAPAEEATAESTAEEATAESTAEEASAEAPAEEKPDEEESPEEIIAALRAEIKALKASMERLTAGLKTPATVQAPRSFRDILAKIPGDLPQQEWDRQYLKARESNPELFNAWINSKH